MGNGKSSGKDLLDEILDGAAKAAKTDNEYQHCLKMAGMLIDLFDRKGISTYEDLMREEPELMAMAFPQDNTQRRNANGI